MRSRYLAPRSSNASIVLLTRVIVCLLLTTLTTKVPKRLLREWHVACVPKECHNYVVESPNVYVAVPQLPDQVPGVQILCVCVMATIPCRHSSPSSYGYASPCLLCNVPPIV